MTASRIAILIALLTITQSGQAQMLSPTPATQAEPVYNALAAQTSSTNNYALLQPISAQSTAGTDNLMQSGLLQPFRDDQNGVSSANATSRSVKITPLSFKRGEFDRHEFKLHNVGSTTIQQATMLFKAPAGSLIQQVIPKPDSVDGSNVVMSVSDLSPGAHRVVEIMIENRSDEFARFDTVVLTEMGGAESVSSYDTQSNSSQTRQYAQVPSESTVKLLEPRSSGMLKPQVPAMQASVARPVQETGRISPLATTNTNAKPLAVKTQRYPKPQRYQESNRYQQSEIYPAAKSNFVTSQPEAKRTVSAVIAGPSQATAGEEVEFSIKVENTVSTTANGVIVQLMVPQNMKVTVLDRAAWYDSDTRKISWELSSIGKGLPETIRYKALFKSAGSINQSIVVGMNQTVQCTSSLKTTAR